MPGAAWADTHSVTIRNGGGETIRGIYFGSAPDSRLRRELPPGAEARITYSTSCRADIRISYASGRTEDHPGIDVCSDPRLVAGQDGTAGPMMAVPAQPSTRPADPRASGPAASPAKAVTTPAKAPPPMVPPWTGKSITKRFGGMD